MKDLTPLDPSLEAELPEQIQLIRKFYFQLSEEDKKKLNQIKIPQPVKTSETRFCYECGQKIPRQAKYCEHCGTKQTETTQPKAKEPTIQEIYGKEKIQQSDETDYFIRTERARLLKKYDCNTMDEVIQKMEKLLQEKNKK